MRLGALEPEDRRRAAEEAREVFVQLRATALLNLLDQFVAADGAIIRAPSTPAADGASGAVASSDEVAQRGG